MRDFLNAQTTQVKTTFCFLNFMNMIAKHTLVMFYQFILCLRLMLGSGLPDSL